MAPSKSIRLGANYWSLGEHMAITALEIPFGREGLFSLFL
jgi:hypothetical protein